MVSIVAPDTILVTARRSNGGRSHDRDGISRAPRETVAVHTVRPSLAGGKAAAPGMIDRAARRAGRKRRRVRGGTHPSIEATDPQ